MGTNVTSRQCANWECPDCGQVCVTGTLDASCESCECTTTINGQVTSAVSGSPISGASIYATAVPYHVLAVSDVSGFFVLNSSCVGSSIDVKREGFKDLTTTLSTQTGISVQMKVFVYPYLTKTPKSKSRLVGETLTLCCEAKADPGIEYYEWFKDSLVLDDALFPTGKNLIMAGITTADSGQYSCRANSPAGSITSPVAYITVKDTSNDFCVDALQQKTIVLPDDCVQPLTNTATYEVGECLSQSCRSAGNFDNGTCSDGVYSCCVPDELTLETAQCSGYTLLVGVVKSCGCGLCEQLSTIQVSGTVRSYNDDSVVAYAKVSVNGELKTFASFQGQYYFTALLDSDVITMNVEDISDTHLPAVKTVETTGGYLTLDIYMFAIPESIPLDSTVVNTLKMGSTSDNSSEKVDIFVPANAFFYPNGTSFNGVVNARSTFLDPTVVSSEDMPGEFQSVDETGETVPLDSFGVFSLYFEDQFGNDLAVSQPISVSLPGSLDQNVTDFMLWILDSETGNWILINGDESSSRRKRQSGSTIVGDLDSSRVNRHVYYNVDKWRRLYGSDICYAKARFFQDSSLTQEMNSLGLVSTRVDSLRTGVLRTFRSRYYLDRDCILLGCRGDETYFQISHSQSRFFVGEPYRPQNIPYAISDEKRVLKMYPMSSSLGPFFPGRSQCRSSINNYHLRFFYEYDPVIRVITPPQEFFMPSLPPGDNYTIDCMTAWYPKIDNKFRICNAKINVLFTSAIKDTVMKLRIISREGGNLPLIKDHTFGFIQYIVNVTKNETYCVEYKCSGSIDRRCDATDFTKVTVQLIYSKTKTECVVSQASRIFAELGNVNPTGNTTGVIEFKAPSSYASIYGLYQETDSSKTGLKTSAAIKVTSNCKEGTGLENGIETFKGPAITFTCYSLPNAG